MNAYERHLQDRVWMHPLALLALMLAPLMVAVVACTVVPKPVKSTVATFSGTNQNSGIITNGPAGWIIDEHKRGRYNVLIAIYGADFLPPVKPDDGLTKLPDGNWRIDSEHLVDLLDMEDWRRSGTR